MEQLKKNLFWIILGVVVLGAVGAWFNFRPDVEEEKKKALAKAADLQKAASASKQNDGLKTPAHAKAAADFVATLSKDKKDLIESIQKSPDFSQKSLNTRYAAAPSAAKNIEFDNWMELQRKRLNDKLATAKIVPPADFDARLFAGVHIDPSLSQLPVDLNSKGSTRHRDYQLRLLAIVDEIVEALIPRTGTLPISKFETDPAKQESTESVQAGALRLESFTFRGPKETADLDKKAFDKAMANTGWKQPASLTQGKPQEFDGPALPVSITSVDVEFVGHISSVPPILRRLEANDKYFAVLTKADCERASLPFPGVLTEAKNATDFTKAAFNPLINTHYGEAPMKAFATLEFYEFDKAKADKMDAPSALPTTVRPKAGK